ncbi:hypothetical protein GCM10017788_14020 [Amycolatopsis acidiphila]|nr:hypothetical protein GCM10017788_14020 [Amycolatopsis acidiphila]
MQQAAQVDRAAGEEHSLRQRGEPLRDPGDLDHEVVVAEYAAGYHVDEPGAVTDEGHPTKVDNSPPVQASPTPRPVVRLNRWRSERW